MARDLVYPGRELELFADAGNWHAYWRGQVRPYIRGEVLEVGAGLGTHTSALLGEGVRRWVALEPDESLASHARESLGVAAAPIEVRHCTSGQLSAAETFDAILYIDVLEHIEDDAGEIARTFHHLAPGGHLIVLAPAHQVLYSAFDAAIGHFRRYSRGMLEGIAPPGATLVLARYLDSAGLLASGANRLLLRQNTPTPQQIRTWDRVLVPVSRVLDRLLGFRAGKSILAIWRKPA